MLIPTSPAEAAEMFGDGGDTLVVGGGTIVVPAIRLGLERPAKALMLHRAGLDGVAQDGGRITIGAGTALEAIAEAALARKIGARGLRMIIEDIMLDLMYTLPGQKKIKECVITREVVESKEKPITVIEKAG